MTYNKKNLYLIVALLALAVFFAGGFYSIVFGGLTINGAEVQVDTQNALDVSRVFVDETVSAKFVYDEILFPNAFSTQQVGVGVYQNAERNRLALAWYVDDQFVQLVGNTNGSTSFPQDGSPEAVNYISNDPFFKGGRTTFVLPSFIFGDPLYTALRDTRFVENAGDLGIGKHKIELKSFIVDETDCITRLNPTSYRTRPNACPIWVNGSPLVDGPQDQSGGLTLAIDPVSESPLSRGYSDTLQEFEPRFTTIAVKNFEIFDLPAPTPVCGDGVCHVGETPDSCPSDCSIEEPQPVCGDGTCHFGETNQSCPSDCFIPEPLHEICDNGIDDDGDGAIDEGCAETPVCGDNTCSANETAITCPVDCSTPEPPPVDNANNDLIALGVGLLILGLGGLGLYFGGKR